MLSRSITLFRLLGFEVKVDLSWLLLAILVVWSLRGYFEFISPGLDPAIYWWMGVIGLLGLAASIVVHEFAHAMVARRYDMPIHGITLFIFGGVAQMEDEPTSPKGEFLMAIAGPLTSVAIAGLFWLATAAVGDLNEPLGLVVAYLAFINLLLAAFNMVPAYPLDGGRVLRSALWAWRKDIVWATRAASFIGSLFGLLLIVLGLLSALSGNLIGGIWWFILGLFVRAASSAALQRTVARNVFGGHPVREFIRRKPISVPSDTTLDELIRDYFYKFYYKSFPVVDDDRLVGCVTVDDVKAVAQEQWPVTRVRAAMRPCGDDNTIEPDVDASEALRRMQQRGVSRLIVARRGRLEGVVSLRDLMAYLTLSADLGATEGGEAPPPRPR